LSGISAAIDIGLGQEAQQIDAARRDAGVARKRDDRNAARARDLACGRHRLCEQGAENKLGALVDRLLRGRLRPRCGAATILEQKLDIWILELSQRQFGGVLHGLRRQPDIAGGRQRQDQSDPDLTGADRAGNLSRLRGRLARRLGLFDPGTELPARAGAEHHRRKPQQAPEPGSAAKRFPHRDLRLPGHGRYPCRRDAGLAYIQCVNPAYSRRMVKQVERMHSTRSRPHGPRQENA
jgi:hypothetical protein